MYIFLGTSYGRFTSSVGALRGRAKKGRTMSKYELAESNNCIAIEVMLPENMIRDLCKYAQFHGRDAQVDIRLRLARSLERERNEETIHQIRSGMTYLNFIPSKD